jgi:DNA-3-methyladenine glycosylase I
MSSGRCPWAEGSALETEYHDREWGVPVHDDRTLFEFLTLEGAQAGLSWRTVLAKRDGYRVAFLDYDLARLARLSDAQLEQRLADPGIVRNRLKVWSVRSNARATQAVVAEFGSLDAFVWSFVQGAPQQPQRRSTRDVPARSEVSERLSKDLGKRGFKFVGSTIMYAWMQAVGLVNDHLLDCPRHAACARLG